MLHIVSLLLPALFRALTPLTKKVTTATGCPNHVNYAIDGGDRPKVIDRLYSRTIFDLDLFHSYHYVPLRLNRLFHSFHHLLLYHAHTVSLGFTRVCSICFIHLCVISGCVNHAVSLLFSLWLVGAVTGEGKVNSYFHRTSKR